MAVDRNQKFVIETGIKIPPIARNTYTLFFTNMQINDSIFVAGAHEDKKFIASVGNMSRRYNLKIIHRRDTKNGEMGVRFWRVK